MFAAPRGIEYDACVGGLPAGCPRTDPGLVWGWCVDSVTTRCIPAERRP